MKGRELATIEQRLNEIHMAKLELRDVWRHKDQEYRCFIYIFVSII